MSGNNFMPEVVARIITLVRQKTTKLNPSEARLIESLSLAAHARHPLFTQIGAGRFRWNGEGEGPSTAALVERFQINHPAEARETERKIKEDAPLNEQEIETLGARFADIVESWHVRGCPDDIPAPTRKALIRRLSPIDWNAVVAAAERISNGRAA
jgi:hypothetical protein